MFNQSRYTELFTGSTATKANLSYLDSQDKSYVGTVKGVGRVAHDKLQRRPQSIVAALADNYDYC